MNEWTVTAAALLTALATGLGPLPLALPSGRRNRRLLTVGHVPAALLMLVASVGLV